MTEFEKPSPPHRRSQFTDYDAIAADCRQSPGEWAVIRDCPVTIGYRINSGGIQAFRPVDYWEATTRSNGRAAHRADIYVRYIGPA